MLIGSDVRVRCVFLYLDPRCTNSTYPPGVPRPRPRRQELVLERQHLIIQHLLAHFKEDINSFLLKPERSYVLFGQTLLLNFPNVCFSLSELHH